MLSLLNEDLLSLLGSSGAQRSSVEVGFQCQSCGGKALLC